MVHGVARRRGTRHLLIENLEILGYRGKFLRGTAQREKRRIEIGHVGLENLWGIALGINSDEDHLQLVTIRTQLRLDLSHFRHGRRADIRAMGVAKENRHHLPGKVGDMPRLAELICERQISGVVNTSDVHPLECWFGRFRASRKKGRSACEQCARSYGFDESSFLHPGYQNT